MTGKDIWIVSIIMIIAIVVVSLSGCSTLRTVKHAFEQGVVR